MRTPVKPFLGVWVSYILILSLTVYCANSGFRQMLALHESHFVSRLPKQLRKLITNMPNNQVGVVNMVMWSFQWSRASAEAVLYLKIKLWVVLFQKNLSTQLKKV